MYYLTMLWPVLCTNLGVFTALINMTANYRGLVMKKSLLLVVVSAVAVLMLTACGPPGIHDLHYRSDLQKYPGLVRKNTREQYDEFKKQTWILGPHTGSYGQYIFLRALADDNKSIDFIQVYVYQTEWDNGGGTGYDFHSAYDANGNKLPFVKISQETGWAQSSYWYQGEVVEDYNHYTLDQAAVMLGYKQLAQNRRDGMRLKVYGKFGDKVVDIPGVYIDDFLSVLEERYDLKRLK